MGPKVHVIVSVMGKTLGVVAASDAIGRSLFGVVRILMKIVGVAR
jgi:hypothetical protein